MHETILHLLPLVAAFAAAFGAGYCCRSRRNAAVEEVIEVAICSLDQRLAKVESVVLLSDEIQ